MRSKTNKAKPPALLGSGRILSTTETMAITGHSDRTSFWQSVKRAGIPYVRISARRAIFRETDLEAWMRAKTVGTIPRGGEAA